MRSSFWILMKNMKIMKIHNFLTFLPSWPGHVLRPYKTNRKSIDFRGAELKKVKNHENSRKYTFLSFAPIPYKTCHIWRLLSKILWKSEKIRKFHKKSLFQRHSPTPYKTCRILRLLRSEIAKIAENPTFWGKTPPKTVKCSIYIREIARVIPGPIFQKNHEFYGFYPPGPQK